MFRSLFFNFFLLTSLALNAQQIDTTAISDATTIMVDSSATELLVDSLQAKKRSFFYRTFKQDYPNPKKAAYLALIPGMGQIYNKKWWKVPLVYGAVTGIVLAIDFNQKNYHRFQTAYLLEVNDNQDHEFTGTRLDDANTLRNLRNGYDKNRQLSYIGAVAVYILQGVDAFVDAHLASFDIDEDLSLQIDPKFITIQQSTAIGLGFSIQF